MPKITVNISDDASILLRTLSDEKCCSQNSIVSQAIMHFAAASDREIEESTQVYDAELQSILSSARSTEKQVEVLYAAFNNFLLQFAAQADDYVSPDMVLHEWMQQALEQHFSAVHKKANKKKWTGDGT